MSRNVYGDGKSTQIPLRQVGQLQSDKVKSRTTMSIKTVAAWKSDTCHQVFSPALMTRNPHPRDVEDWFRQLVTNMLEPAKY
jgi:hypothetical protein